MIINVILSNVKNEQANLFIDAFVFIYFGVKSWVPEVYKEL